ncbi:hypothetical protein [Halorussus marinus]|uniref:hypothetical protein n=1 Tax=Halorussus marinus TaxID=2505976 RepID=UPI00142F3FDE|nr:hypothetical protein [Halorussus marinus]
MAVPRPETPVQIALVAVGAAVAFVVVLPLVPTLLDLLAGTVRGVVDAVVPGGPDYRTS